MIRRFAAEKESAAVSGGPMIEALMKRMGYLLSRTAAHVRRRTVDAFQPFGIIPPQYAVLAAREKRPDDRGVAHRRAGKKEACAAGESSGRSKVVSRYRDRCGKGPFRQERQATRPVGRGASVRLVQKRAGASSEAADQAVPQRLGPKYASQARSERSKLRPCLRNRRQGLCIANRRKGRIRG